MTEFGAWTSINCSYSNPADRSRPVDVIAELHCKAASDGGVKSCMHDDDGTASVHPAEFYSKTFYRTEEQFNTV